MAIVIPAILTNNEEEYRSLLQKAENAADVVQIDVIDGKFANNKTVGVDVIAKVQTRADLEIQLMVNEPIGYVRELGRLEHVLRIIVPYESKEPPKEAVYEIKKFGKQAGLSLNPDTGLEVVRDLAESLDMVLFLAVNPGFSEQGFQEKVLEKVRDSKRLFPDLPIQVDGGVKFENARKIVEAGAGMIAANSVIFKADDFYVAFEKLAKLAS